MDPLSTTASIIAIIQALGASWKIYSSLKDASKDIKELQNEIIGVDALIRGVEELLRGPGGQKLAQSKDLSLALAGCSSVLEALKKKLGTPKERKFFGVVKTHAKWPFKEAEVIKTVEALERWKQSINLALSTYQTSDMININQKIDLAGLPVAEGAGYKSFKDQHEPECLPGTRADLIKCILDWTEDPQSQCIFWLSGIAGTGKSTLSRTIAKNMEDKKQLAGSFFFKRGEKDRGDATKLFTTLAYQLANHIRKIVPSIQKALEENPTISTMALREQFDKLIFRPLSQMEQPPGQLHTTVLVIDALDECDGERDQQIIISLLARLKEIRTTKVYVFLTSRPELPIRLGFKELSGGVYQDMILHKVPGVEQDIKAFLTDEFAKMRKDHALPIGWPDVDYIQKLAEMAVPLFIFAATACRFVGDKNWDPEERIKIVIEYQRNDQLSKLDKTYLPILEQFICQDAAETEALCEEFRKIVGTIITLANTLSVPALANLIGIPIKSIDRRLKLLHSVLDIPEGPNRDSPIRIFHLSFRDFLYNERLCENSRFRSFWINEKLAHQLIAKWCIDLMSGPDGLKKNICHLDSPGILRSEIESSLVEEYISAELQYACRYWVYHLQHSGNKTCDDGQEHKFLQGHLLHWLEASSLLGFINDTISMIDILALNSVGKDNMQISSLVHDIKRFLLQNRAVIDMAPMQIYLSAIIFSPGGSIVRKTFAPAEATPWLHYFLPVPDQWSNLLQTISVGIGASCVSSIDFSPDCEILASIVDRPIAVKIWDAYSGALLQTLEVPGSSLDRWGSVAFSPDAKILAIGASRFLELWDTTTWSVRHKLKEHTGKVQYITFSSDSKIVASATLFKIRIWDTVTGTILHTLVEQSGALADLGGLTFSLDNQILVSTARRENTFNLWDTKTGALQQQPQTMERHFEIFGDAAFFSKGTMIASASKEGPVRLWNLDSWTILEGTTNAQKAVLSRDGKLLAVALEDGRIKLLDMDTRAWILDIERQDHEITDLSFSIDSGILASASNTGNVRMWDIKMKLDPYTAVAAGHTGAILDITISPDSTLLASASDDKTVGLWQAATGLLIHTFQGHTEGVFKVVFSAGGKLLASGAPDATVFVWDVIERVLLQKFRVQASRPVPEFIVFSPDNKYLAASAAHPYHPTAQTKLWNTATGELLWSIKKETYSTSLVFSPSSLILATAMGGTVYIWDRATGNTSHIFELHQSDIHSIAFSPDSSCLSSASYDNTIKVWKIANQDPPITFKLDPSHYTDNGKIDRLTFPLSFSKDGKVISIDQQSFLCNPLCNPSNSSLVSFPKIQSKRICLQSGWLTLDGERLIWLPVGYSCVTRHDNRIYFGNSGKVYFIGFNFMFDDTFSISACI